MRTEYLMIKPKSVLKIRESTDSSEHNNCLDLLRLVSAFAIIWYHLKAPCRSIAYGGLICFVEISGYLMAGKGGGSGYAGKRFHRLIVPWLFWSIVYGIVNVVKGNRFSGRIENPFGTLFTGTSIHLWYLPFLYFVSISFLPLIPFMRKLRDSVVFHLVMVALTGLSLIGAFAVRTSLLMGEPWTEWVHAFPAILMGIAMGLSAESGLGRGVKDFISWCLLLTVAAVSIFAMMKKQEFLGVPYLVGTIFTTFCLKSQMRSIPLIRAISELSMGIYLVHPLIVSVFHRWTSFISDPALIAITAFTTSIFITLFIKGVYIPKISFALRKII